MKTRPTPMVAGLLATSVVLLGAKPAPPAALDTTTVVPADAEILGDAEVDDEWSIESVRFRFSYMLQDGRGYQSKADPDELGRGSEEIVVIQPLAQVDIRQNEKVSHTVFFPVDVVTMASADALDAVSQASAMTEAATLDITTRYQASDEWQFAARYGIHWEEPMTSFLGGLSLTKSMADDNAVLSIGTLAIVDLFDWTDPDGFDLGVTSRAAYNGNVSLSQILSPTTIAAVTYGVTHQRGTLMQTWNSVLVDDVPPVNGNAVRIAELFPETRTRHAFGVRAAQHIPWTRSTIKAAYRYYLDDYDLTAHTVTVNAYQYLSDHIYVRGDYRFYTQDGVEFFTTSVPLTFDQNLPRTSDSDLGAFDAHEYGFRVVYLFNPAGSANPGNEYFGVSFSRYDRTTGLDINTFSISYGHGF